VQGLVEKPANTTSEMMNLIEFGHSIRTTHHTASNDTSSRSHAICWVSIRDSNNKIFGKLSLVDLAGSERAADC
jgi:kinesin family protein 2/24